jgi:nitrite reductase (NADH) small subunit
MKKVFFCRLNELQDEKFTIRKINGKEIGGIIVDGIPKFVLNFCPHAGAPICLGKIDKRIDSEVVGKTHYSNSQKIIVCPWHKWEFDFEKGTPLVKSKGKLMFFKYEIVEDDIYIKVR